MKLAVIAPPNALGVVATMRASFHLVLAQYVEDPTYNAFYRSAHRRGDFIMLDNGAGESSMLTMPALLKAASLVWADEITLPDVIGDCDETLRVVSEALPMVSLHKRAVCPHGSSWGEWERCAIELMKMGCATICIGRYDRLPDGRFPAFKIIEKHQWHWNHHIHLFGCFEPPIRATRLELAAAPWLRSMDTGAPIAYAQQGRILDDGPHASLQWNVPFHSRVAEQNIERLTDVCNGA
jgi:hypothetical protein